jgi:D-amino peptidase
VRVFISADMEGISSVTGWYDVTPGTAEYETARVWMTDDVNGAILGALDAGAQRILVNDGHGNHRNLIPERLDAHAELIRGYTKPLGMMEGIDGGWDAVFFIGYHARLSVRDGLLGHTLSPECFRDIRLNGRSVSEAELNAAVAGTFGVPVVLISGDSSLDREIKGFLPAVQIVVVKTSLEYETAILVHPSITRDRIRQAARLALEGTSNVTPYCVETPCVIEAEFQETATATLASSVPTVARVGAATVRFEAPDAAVALKILKVFLRLGS